MTSIGEARTNRKDQYGEYVSAKRYGKDRRICDRQEEKEKEEEADASEGDQRASTTRTVVSRSIRVTKRKSEVDEAR